MRNKYVMIGLGLALIAIAVLLMMRRGQKYKVADGPETIVLYNWSEYMDPSVLDDFTKETNIKVIEEIFDSNETVRAKLLAGADGYDVIVPSGVMITTLIRENLLEK